VLWGALGLSKAIGSFSEPPPQIRKDNIFQKFLRIMCPCLWQEPKLPRSSLDSPYTHFYSL